MRSTRPSLLSVLSVALLASWGCGDSTSNDDGGAGGSGAGPTGTGGNGAGHSQGGGTAVGGGTSDGGSTSAGGGGTTTSSALCEGRFQGQGDVPFSDLSRPGVGEAVTDPDFGTTILRVTDAGSGDAITPVYSTVPAWNADGSVVLLYRWGSGHELYDASTFEKIGDLDCATSDGWHPGPSDVEHVMWDPSDPKIIYFPSLYAPGNAGPLPIVYRCDVTTGVAAIAHDFRDAPTSCSAGDELSMGDDPQWFPGAPVGLQCGDTTFIYDVFSDVVHGVKTGAPFDTGVAPIAAPSGTLVYFDGAVFDMDLSPVRSLDIANPEEHANIGRRANGDDVYYAVDFDGDDPSVIAGHDMQTGERIPLVSESNGWGYPATGIHISSVVHDHRGDGWVLASVVGDPSVSAPLDQELVFANADTGEVCRVGRHRSAGGDGPNGYQAEPHPVWHFRDNGDVEILFASDWGGGGSVDTYVLRFTPGG